MTLKAQDHVFQNDALRVKYDVLIFAHAVPGRPVDAKPIDAGTRIC
jgi:hypothetical protein